MAKAPDPLAAFLCDQLQDWAPVTARRLFGGWGIYNGPTMFGLILRDTIYFRVDDRNRPDYLAAAMPPFVHAARRRAAETTGVDAPRFQYRTPSGKVVAMPYYEVPAAVLDDPDDLALWAGKAYDAALRAARGKTAARKPKPASRARVR